MHQCVHVCVRRCGCVREERERRERERERARSRREQMQMYVCLCECRFLLEGVCERGMRWGKGQSVKGYYLWSFKLTWLQKVCSSLRVGPGRGEGGGGLLLLVGCLTSQQHESVSHGRICLDNSTCCHTEIEDADQTFHPTRSQYTDTGPTSPSTDPMAPGAWQVATGMPILKSLV